MDAAIARVRRCIQKPSPRNAVVHKRLEHLQTHLMALNEIISNIAKTVPVLLPYMTRAAIIYNQLLHTASVLTDLENARRYYQRAINKSMDLLEDYEDMGISTNYLFAAIESFELLLEHHDGLVNTFGFFVYNAKV